MERRSGDGDGPAAPIAETSAEQQSASYSGGSDVREDVRAHLRWEFSYASTDPMEARCLVAMEAGGGDLDSGKVDGNGTVAEWLVRKFTSPDEPSAADGAVREAAVAANAGFLLREAKSHKIGGGLETQLENELRFSKRQATTRGSQSKRLQKVEQVCRFCILFCTMQRMTSSCACL